MDCIKYRKLISAYIDNELTEYESQEIILHLKSCESCKIFYKNQIILKEEIKKSFNETVNNYNKSQEIMSKIYNKKKNKNGRRKKRVAWMAIAALLGIITLTYFLYSMSPKDQIAKEYKLEKYVAEHLDKNNVITINSDISQVNYEK